MTKPVRGISDDGNRRKETKTDTPPPEFDKERLTVSEIDPDAQSKWKALRQNPTELESSQPPQSPMQAMEPQQSYQGNTPTSSQPITQTSDTAYIPPPVQQDQTDLPTSYNFYYEERNTPPPIQTSTDTNSDSSSSSDDQTTDDDSTKKTDTKLDKQEIKDKLETPEKLPDKEKFTKELKTTEKPTKETDTTGKSTPKETQKSEKTTIPETKKNKEPDTKEQFTPTEKESKTQVKEPKKNQDIETGVSPQKENITTPTSDKDKDKDKDKVSDKTSLKIDAPVQIQSIQVTPEIQQQAFQSTQGVAAYLDPKVESLYQNMVGAIIQTKKSGIEKTEVLLNQPNLKSTQFYGSKVTLTRYSTDPYSYNIALSTPNPKALTQFSNHLDSLRTAFLQANFDFKVGRLEANYVTDRKEQFIFKRKEGAGEKDMGSDKEKEK